MPLRVQEIRIDLVVGLVNSVMDQEVERMHRDEQHLGKTHRCSCQHCTLAYVRRQRESRDARGR